MLWLLPVALGAGCRDVGDDPGPPVAVDPAALYAKMCVQCHGTDGKGNPQLAGTMPVRDFSDPQFLSQIPTEQLERVIMGGKGQMPPFGNLLSQPKIQALAGFVRRLGAGQEPPVKVPGFVAPAPTLGSTPAPPAGATAAPPAGAPAGVP